MDVQIIIYDLHKKDYSVIDKYKFMTQVFMVKNKFDKNYVFCT